LAYPGRKVHDVLPQFVGTNVIKPTAEQRAELLAFVAKKYPAGRSLRELTGRTQGVIRRPLDDVGIRRRGPVRRRRMW
jgi:Helix-turn-helix domain